MASLSSLVFSLILLISCHFHGTEAQKLPPIAKGLSLSFYDKSCPKLEAIVRKQLQKVFRNDIGQAAGLLRLHFHDCFVQSGGPDYPVPLGRRDGLTFATGEATNRNLVSPFANTTTVLVRFASKNLDTTDAIALSGGHTIGISHCSSFTNRLYPKQDPTMDETFASNLKRSCPTENFNNTVVLDISSPNKFDNKYYVALMKRQGLFTSDQDLYTDTRTRGIVTAFAGNEALFFEKFVIAMVKMGQMSVLTGTQGEIRGNCSARNRDNSLLSTVVEEVEEIGLSMF